MSEWQSIETAPKDGTLILLMQVRNSEYEAADIEIGCFEFIEFSDWDGKAVYGWTTNTGHIEEPTHWMPLPEPPP